MAEKGPLRDMRNGLAFIRLSRSRLIRLARCCRRIGATAHGTQNDKSFFDQYFIRRFSVKITYVLVSE
ncbi:hypothetical protein [Brevibacillus massiliensis]|uniref:hypothetical protein n=1 Tax=Brevibacillus massiliensis TaxID=1118054 RepID=UPI0003624391|nr:hypothetical protein [Brevibacillus massiliensis]